jgi:hypothetical protein
VIISQFVVCVEIQLMTAITKRFYIIALGRHVAQRITDTFQWAMIATAVAAVAETMAVSRTPIKQTPE